VNARWLTFSLLFLFWVSSQDWMFTFAKERGVQICFERLAHALIHRSPPSAGICSKWVRIQEWMKQKPAIQIAEVIRAFFENDFGVAAFLDFQGVDVGPFLVLLKGEDDILIKKLIFETLAVRNLAGGGWARGGEFWFGLHCVVVFHILTLLCPSMIAADDHEVQPRGNYQSLGSA
jgi:hypothetical protein